MGTVNASSYMDKQEIAIVDIWFGIEKRFCSCHTVDVIGKVDGNWDTVFNFCEVEIFPIRIAC